MTIRALSTRELQADIVEHKRRMGFNTTSADREICLAMRELRGCAWPDCGAFYDPLAVMEGRQEAPGWRRHSGFMLSMCAEHAVLAWGPDYSRHRATGSTGTACGCGGTLDPTGPTLGHLAAAYVRHLVDSAA
jgi:hypothetical protein